MSINEKNKLSEPVSEEDVLDQEDYIDSLLHTQKLLADRVAYQAGAQHPVAIELKYIHDLIDYAGNRLADLRKTKCFPSEDQIERSNGQR
jgi:hypothetical protein